MTRPRVSPEKRQRTAQACDSCKRRKQKCNGIQPCDTCIKRSLSCTFKIEHSENGSDEHASKRRLAEQDHSPVSNATLSLAPPTPLESRTLLSPQVSTPAINESAVEQNARSLGLLPTGFPRSNIAAPTRGLGDISSDLLSRGSKDGSVQEEEAMVYHSSRMLQDPRGRLLYVGDSATLSYLQLIRMIVESVAGPSPFTLDPQRHRIVESSISLPQNIRNTYLLPDRATALILIDAFFINTSGLVQVFDRRRFMNTLESCYSDPLAVDPSWLCLLHLTFAIGLVLASPLPSTREFAVIQKLRAEPENRADIFYCNATKLSDPTAGLEDSDFSSVQALLLMTLYNLAVSKRNAANAYYGMASRSAFALGLHRIETLSIFNEEEQQIRRNLFRSLYVLDRFLSASLGRPTAISDDECSPETLNTSSDPSMSATPFFSSADQNYSSALGLDASVRSCQVIGVILKKVYSKRKISTKLAQEIADQCRLWPRMLDAALHWRQVTAAGSMNPSQGIAILHVNLLHCHTIILLTRPFFLFILSKVQQERHEMGQRHQRFMSRMEKFSEACVIASSHTIVLVQNAWEGQYLSHRDPFVTYFLFAASLIVLSNEFSKLYLTPNAESCIKNSIDIMAYCGETDPLAQRLLFILTSFRDVVNRQQEKIRTRHIVVGSDDPFVNLFGGIELTPETIAMKSGPISSHTPSTTSNSVGPGSHPTNSKAVSHPATLSRHGSIDGGSEGIGDGEIDFDALWNMPTTVMTPGLGMGVPGFDPNNVQAITDSIVPLYGMTEYGGN